MTPYQLQDAIDRVVMAAKKDAEKKAPQRNGKQLLAAFLTPVVGPDTRKGDPAKLRRIYTAVRWLYETHDLDTSDMFFDPSFVPPL